MSNATKADTGLSKANVMIDGILDVRLQSWRELVIYEEVALLYANKGVNNKARLTFGNWNANGMQLVERGGDPQSEPDNYTVDREGGVLTLVDPWIRGEEIVATYNFNYFPYADLYQLLKFAVSVVNTTGVPQTSYALSEAPEAWDGLITEIAYMEALKKIRLDSTVWKSFVLLRIDPNDAMQMISEEIGSSIERVNGMVEGSKHLKRITLPTAYYWMAARGGIGIGIDGVGTGKFRGIRMNRSFF